MKLIIEIVLKSGENNLRGRHMSLLQSLLIAHSIASFSSNASCLLERTFLGYHMVFLLLQFNRDVIIDGLMLILLDTINASKFILGYKLGGIKRV